MDFSIYENIENNLLLPDGLVEINGIQMPETYFDIPSELETFFLKNHTTSKRIEESGETLADIHIAKLKQEKHAKRYIGLSYNSTNLSIRDFLSSTAREYYDNNGFFRIKVLEKLYSDGNIYNLEHFDCWQAAQLINGDIDLYSGDRLMQSTFLSGGKRIHRLRQWDISRPLIGVIGRQWPTKYDRMHTFTVIPYTINGVPLVITKNGGAYFGGYMIPLIIQDLNLVFRYYTLDDEDKDRPDITNVRYYQF